jgi:hypothetical protein
MLAFMVKDTKTFIYMSFVRKFPRLRLFKKSYLEQFSRNCCTFISRDITSVSKPYGQRLYFSEVTILKTHHDPVKSITLLAV